jgi:hypothetical protein
MNDYVDELIAEQGNENGLLLEVLTSGYEEWDFLFAVEGPSDRAFYFDFLRNELPNSELKLLDCGGKAALLKFKDAVEAYPWVNPPQFRFLCDKDFDDYRNLQHPGVWKTKYYSIESYLVQSEYIHYCIRKLSSGHIPMETRKDFIKRFESHFRRMAKEVRAYCAFMCEVRCNDEHPTFDGFSIDKLFDVSNSNVPRRRHILSNAATTLAIERPVKFGALLARARSFSLDNILGWLRGKLALQLARKCYERTKAQTPTAKRSLFPPANFLSGDAFSSAFLYWRSLDGLSNYCKASHESPA